MCLQMLQASPIWRLLREQLKFVNVPPVFHSFESALIERCYYFGLLNDYILGNRLAEWSPSDVYVWCFMPISRMIMECIAQPVPLQAGDELRWPTKGLMRTEDADGGRKKASWFHKITGWWSAQQLSQSYALASVSFTVEFLTRRTMTIGTQDQLMSTCLYSGHTGSVDAMNVL